jgi:hypothetical protein
VPQPRCSSATRRLFGGEAGLRCGEIMALEWVPVICDSLMGISGLADVEVFISTHRRIETKCT